MPIRLWAQKINSLKDSNDFLKILLMRRWCGCLRYLDIPNIIRGRLQDHVCVLYVVKAYSLIFISRIPVV